LRSIFLAAVAAIIPLADVDSSRTAAVAGQPAIAQSTKCTCRTQAGWQVAETGNFSIWSRLSQRDTTDLAARCEELRESLAERWLDDREIGVWTPKCVVVLHANLAEYSRVFGSGTASSVGCTTITADGGRIVFRRIDLRSDAADWHSNALPHELTHVVLAGRFPGRQLPHWLNEGLAMTSETVELQQRRLDVLDAARTTGSLPTLEHFLTLDNPMQSLEADLVYAVSFSLVDYLRDQWGEERLLEFVDRALDKDCDAALRDVYQIEGGLKELQQRWSATPVED